MRKEDIYRESDIGTTDAEYGSDRGFTFEVVYDLYSMYSNYGDSYQICYLTILIDHRLMVTTVLLSPQLLKWDFVEIPIGNIRD